MKVAITRCGGKKGNFPALSEIPSYCEIQDERISAKKTLNFAESTAAKTKKMEIQNENLKLLLQNMTKYGAEGRIVPPEIYREYNRENDDI